MIVPPFIPQPLEISGNAADRSYAERLLFVRRVCVCFFLSTALWVGAAYLPLEPLGTLSGLEWALLMLAALSVIRLLARGHRAEQYWSLVLFPFLGFALAEAARDFTVLAGPPWLLAVGPLTIMLCTLVAGRDHSFVGVYACASFVTLLVYLVMGLTGHCGAWWPLLTAISLGQIAFVQYDLAMILRRRRTGEELGAAVDLYRDVLNCLTYPIRVWRHWQKHRIWSIRLDLGDAHALAWQSVTRAAARVRSRFERWPR